MGSSLKDFNEKRSAAYCKDDQAENFLLGMNQLLQEQEMAGYRDYAISRPFIFIFGAPRSGTTLISQLIAHSFDIGYINNLIARFWLAPLHGIKLSKTVLGSGKETLFQSDYARTSQLTDIHEFGYFWRHWLKKETLEDITRVAERESAIDWPGLKKVLTNMQHEFDKPMVFKNIFGSYHLSKMKAALGKVIYVYIERDPLDTAVSILDARRKYYQDLNTWWSYTPVEYHQIKNLDYWEQIAGQVFFLHRFYQRQIESSCQNVTVRIQYRDLCQNPRGVLEKIQNICRENYQDQLRIISEPPRKFSFRTYHNRDQEKVKFRELFEKFGKENA